MTMKAVARGDLHRLEFKAGDAGRDVEPGLALHADFGVPIHKSIDFLMTHPVGTADLQFGFDGIISKKIGDIAELYLNVGFRHINQPAHVSVIRLAQEIPLGFGFTVPLSARLQLVGESTAEVFAGKHTPNTTFGAEDPVDATLGIRANLGRSFSVTGGYRRPLNQFGGDKNGFAVTLNYIVLSLPTTLKRIKAIPFGSR